MMIFKPGKKCLVKGWLMGFGRLEFRSFVTKLGAWNFKEAFASRIPFRRLSQDVLPHFLRAICKLASSVCMEIGCSCLLPTSQLQRAIAAQSVSVWGDVHRSSYHVLRVWGRSKDFCCGFELPDTMIRPSGSWKSVRRDTVLYVRRSF